jgi:hypothetical protein
MKVSQLSGAFPNYLISNSLFPQQFSPLEIIRDRQIEGTLAFLRSFLHICGSRLLVSHLIMCIRHRQSKPPAVFLLRRAPLHFRHIRHLHQVCEAISSLNRDCFDGRAPSRNDMIHIKGRWFCWQSTFDTADSCVEPVSVQHQMVNIEADKGQSAQDVNWSATAMQGQESMEVKN